MWCASIRCVRDTNADAWLSLHGRGTRCYLHVLLIADICYQYILTMTTADLVKAAIEIAATSGILVCNSNFVPGYCLPGLE